MKLSGRDANREPADPLPACPECGAPFGAPVPGGLLEPGVRAALLLTVRMTTYGSGMDSTDPIRPDARSATAGFTETPREGRVGPTGLFASTELGEPESGAPILGVDPSTLRVSMAAAFETDSRVVTRQFSKFKGDDRVGDRLAHIFEQTCELARDMVVRYGVPERVFVEQASGKHMQPPLQYAVGATLTALAVTLRVPVVTIPSGTWKLHGVGYGAAKKPEILAWARRCEGYAGESQDEADALGIARAGWRLTHAPVQTELAA